MKTITVDKTNWKELTNIKMKTEKATINHVITELLKKKRGK